MAPQLRFDGQVAVVTGAGAGLGRSYALLLGSRGAKVVVNDLGGGLNGEGQQLQRVADTVVEEIRSTGGIAVADYNDVTKGDKIIETAVKAFGTVHILINNAGILRDISFGKMTDKDWDLIQNVHMYGHYKTTRAAWALMQKQSYGRIVCVASGAGIYGSFGQTNYSSAKAGIIGFSNALGKEGVQYGIKSNVLAPIAASRLTQTVMTPELLEKLNPEWVAPVVAVLAHKDSNETTGVFELGAGFISKFRIERSAGAKTPIGGTWPQHILESWSTITDFGRPSYAQETTETMSLSLGTQGLPQDSSNEKLSFNSQVAVVFGAGTGVGRQYALFLAKVGIKVVVNATSSADANQIVTEIQKAGGQAKVDINQPENSSETIKAAVEAFGAVHILIYATEAWSSKPLEQTNDRDWSAVYDSHTRGSYKATQAAWPYMLQQKYGRIVYTSSYAGLYGLSNATSYSAGTMGVAGFMRALFREGQKYNIRANAIAIPVEATPSSQALSVSLAACLCSERVPRDSTGGIYEVGSDWVSKTRWQRSGGHLFPTTKTLTPEDVVQEWNSIATFDNRSDYPGSPAESLTKMLGNVGVGNTYKPKQLDAKLKEPCGQISGSTVIEKIKLAQQTQWKGCTYTYTVRDLLLYNLGVGARHEDLRWVFEQDPNFTVLPTFGVIPGLDANVSVDLTFLPNYALRMVLHGEQYLEIRKWPLPPSGTLVTTPRLISVLDKGNAAVATIACSTVDGETGAEYFYNETTTFLRGMGGFGGDRSSATKAVSFDVPVRLPDNLVEETTSEDQATLYRLSGDYNPLHIDPKNAQDAGFKGPILHGLCTLGFAGRCINQKYGMFRVLRNRFIGTVMPGQKLGVKMWRDGERRLVFQVVVVETNKEALRGVAELQADSGSRL